MSSHQEGHFETASLYDGDFLDSTLQDALDTFGIQCTHGVADPFWADIPVEQTAANWIGEKHIPSRDRTALIMAAPAESLAAEAALIQSPSSMNVAADEPFIIAPALKRAILGGEGAANAFRTAGDEGILPGSTDVEVLDAETEGQFALLGDNEGALMHESASVETRTFEDMLLLGPVSGMPLQVQVPAAAARHHHMCSPSTGTLSPGSSHSFSRSIASAFSSQSALSSNIVGMPMFFGELGGQPMSSSRMHFGSASPSRGTSVIRSSRSMPCLSKLHDYDIDDEDSTDPSDGGSEGEPGREEARTCSRPPSPVAAAGSLPARRVISRPRRPTTLRYEVELERQPAKSPKKRSGSGNQAGVTVPNPNGIACTACGAKVTPVWRAGPHGPKTLCNACGVRYMKVAKRK